MENKRCNGPLHPPGGSLVPLSDFTFNQTGSRVGMPLSRCKYCRSSGNARTVPSYVFMPLIEILFEGRKLREVARLVDLDKQLISDIRQGKRKKIYKNTFLNIKRAVDRLPKEKISIGPKNKKSKRNGLDKLSYEERMGLKQLVSIAQKERYKKEKSLLKHVL